ncbi:GNAT family N-acetyltransferase [Streptomyces sp. MS06]|uniref:GNAT family N-acetyltransferase n=1 Tax=Streptomyces sp. MS06 TaxID=3385974 RepID=UPI0039A3F6A8
MGVVIRAAVEQDRELVVRVLDEAFQDDPVSSWVFPGADYRRRTHHRLMAAFTDTVLAEGSIDLVEDGSACALWLSLPGGDAQGGDRDGGDRDGGTEPAGAGTGGAGTGRVARGAVRADDDRQDDQQDGRDAEAAVEAVGGQQDGEPDGPARMRDAVDPDNERVELIGRLTEGIHPEGRAHAYLWMIGVAPGHQGEGLGGALLAHRLEHCDRIGLPAYLEASSARSRRLYERLGFVDTGRPLDLPDGPRMWPMWREPRAHGQGAPSPVRA